MYKSEGVKMALSKNPSLLSSSSFPPSFFPLLLTFILSSFFPSVLPSVLKAHKHFGYAFRRVSSGKRKQYFHNTDNKEII